MSEKSPSPRWPLLSPSSAPRTLIAAAALLAGALLLTGDTAKAAGGTTDVKGKVQGTDKLLPDVYVDAAKPESHRWNWREPSPTVSAAARVLSADPSREVCVAAIAGGPQPAHEPILVKVTGGRTIPTTIVIPPKTRLAFKNFDPFEHWLFQKGEPKWAPAKTSGNGATREWVAPEKPDVYEIDDTLFPSVRMKIRVEPNVAAFVFPNAKDGTFTLSLPAGQDFTLRAYFQGNAASRDLPVHVPDHGPFDLPSPLTVGGDSK